MVESIMAFIAYGSDNRLQVLESRFEIELLELETTWEWIELEGDRGTALAVCSRMEASGKPPSTCLCDYVINNSLSVLAWRSSELAGIL
jgi:hypothetical protein